MISKQASKSATHITKLISAVAQSIRNEVGTGKIKDEDSQLLIAHTSKSLLNLLDSVSKFDPAHKAHHSADKKIGMLLNKLPKSFSAEDEVEENEIDDDLNLDEEFEEEEDEEYERKNPQYEVES